MREGLKLCQKPEQASPSPAENDGSNVARPSKTLPTFLPHKVPPLVLGISTPLLSFYKVGRVDYSPSWPWTYSSKYASAT